MTYRQKLAQAFQAHHRHLVYWLQKRAVCCQSTAEDIAGEAWLRIIQKQLPPDFALLRTIAKGILRDRARRERLIPVADVPDVVMSPQREEPLALPINRLPPVYQEQIEAIRAVVSDPQAKGTARDTALRLGIPVETFHYRRKVIRQFLSGEIR